jgi:hypothetical protein
MVIVLRLLSAVQNEPPYYDKDVKPFFVFERTG